MSKITAYKRREQRPPAARQWQTAANSDDSRRKGERLQTCLRDRGLPRYARMVRGSARRFFFSVRQTPRELNEAPKLSASEESAITCHGHLCLPWSSWTTGGSIVCLLEDDRNSQGHNLFCTSEVLTLCQLADASVVGLLKLLLKLPGQTINIWCDNIVISYRYIHISHYQQQKPTRAHFFLAFLS